MTSNSAGLWVRVGASILDSIVLFFVLSVLSYGLYGEFYTGDSFTPLDVINLLYYLLLPLFWAGYTVGKRALGVRIVRVDGRKLGIGTMLLRNLVAGIVYVLTLGIGIIVSAFMVGLRQDHRSIHDLIAGTYVTYDRP